MTEPETLASGQVLDGKYKIDATLGKGGMGMVYRAQHLGLNAYRAIKVMHNKFAEDEDFLRRFRNEAQLAEGLRHPNLCTLYDLSRLPDGSWYIVWEYVEGETLANMLQRGASFTLAQVTEMVAQVADESSDRALCKLPQTVNFITSKVACKHCKMLNKIHGSIEGTSRIKTIQSA